MALGTVLLVALGVKLIYQLEMFRRASKVTEDIVQLVDRMPSGTAFWMVCENRRILRQNLHAGDYGLARSGAISSNYYARPLAQPIWFRQPPPAAVEMPDQLTNKLVGATMAHFPFAIVCGFADSSSQSFSPYATAIATAGPCSLWQSTSTATASR